MYPKHTFRFICEGRLNEPIDVFIYDFSNSKSMVEIKPDSSGYYTYNIPDVHYGKKYFLGIPTKNSSPEKLVVLKIKKNGSDNFQNFQLDELLKKENTETKTFTLSF